MKLERENLREIASSAFLLKESDKLYKTLFNSISHEFRIPVTTIMGASDTLLTEVYDVEVQHNLLLNATQHAIPGSSIDVSFIQNQDKMTIQVCNDGSALKENEENLVFEKFYRGDKNKTGNMGLGLSIVKGFVEAHKGMVNAKNKQNGDGVIFTIELPSEKSNFTNLPNK